MTAHGFDATELVELLSGVDFPIPAPADIDLPLDPIAYFASGCQRGEVAGFAAIGHDVGVAAGSVNADVEGELCALAGTDVQAFIDSGAFAEFRAQLKGKSAPVKWDKVIALYKRVGAVLGDQLHVVAPDAIGDQGETLARLERYAEDMRELDAMGVRVLMPVQRGTFTQESFYRRCVEVLGFEPIPALPCRASATSVEEAEQFVAAVQPTVIHLLGLGPRGHKAKRYLARIAEACAFTMVQMDSCIIAAHAGKTKGPGGGPRRLTAAAGIVNGMAERGELSSDVQTRKAAGVILALRDMDTGKRRELIEEAKRAIAADAKIVDPVEMPAGVLLWPEGPASVAHQHAFLCHPDGEECPDGCDCAPDPLRVEALRAAPDLFESCEKCGAVLLPGREVWLELDSTTGKWWPEGAVPDERSQGCFAFGADCARKAVKR